MKSLAKSKILPLKQLKEMDIIIQIKMSSMILFPKETINDHLSKMILISLLLNKIKDFVKI